MESFKQVRRPWTKEEDVKLLSFVERYKHDLHAHWTDIAKLTDGRNSKQCRDRYLHHLAEGTDKTPYLPSEERALFALQAEVGNKWAEIARRLPGRTESSVKNRYYSALRRVQRACGGDADEAAALLSTFAQMQVVRLGVTTGRAGSANAPSTGAGHSGGWAGDAPAYDAAGKRLQFEDEVLKAMEKEGKGVTGPGEESKALRSRLLSAWLATVGPAGLSLATSLLPGAAGTEQGGTVQPVPRLQLHRFAGTAEESGSAADASSGLSSSHMTGGGTGGGSSRSASKMAKRADGRTARTAGGSARRGKASARAAAPPLVPHDGGGDSSSAAVRGPQEAMLPAPFSSSALPFHRAAAWDPTARPLSPATSVEGELGMDVCGAVGESTLELPAFAHYPPALSALAGGASGGRVQGAKGGVAPLRLGAVNGRYMQESPQVMWNGSDSSAPAPSLPSAGAAVEESGTPGRRGGKSKLPTLDRIIAVPVPVRPGKDGLPVPIQCGGAGQHEEATGVVMVPTVMVRPRPTGVKRNRQPSLDSSDYSSSSYSSDEEEGTSHNTPQGYGNTARLMAGIWGPVAAPRAATPTGFPVAGLGRPMAMDSSGGGHALGTPVRVGGAQGLSPLAHSSAGGSRSASALAAVLGATALDTPVRLSSAPQYAGGGPAFSFSSSRSAVRSPADLLLPVSGALPQVIPAAWSSYGSTGGGSERSVALPSPPVLTPLRPLDLPFRLAPHPSAAGSGPSSHSGGTAGSPVHEESRVLAISLTATIAREGGGDKAVVDRRPQGGQENACCEGERSPREQPLLQMLAAAAGFD